MRILPEAPAWGKANSPTNGTIPGVPKPLGMLLVEALARFLEGDALPLRLLEAHLPQVPDRLRSVLTGLLLGDRAGLPASEAELGLEGDAGVYWHQHLRPQIADRTFMERLQRTVWNEEPTASGALRFMGVKDLLAQPDVRWLVKGILEEGQVAICFGLPQVGKSAVMLSLALAVSAGHDWAERQTAQGGAVWLAGEGSRGLGRRLKAWDTHELTADLEGDLARNFKVIPTAIPWTDPRAFNRLLELLDTLDEPPKLLVADSLNRCLGSVSENANESMAGLFHGVAELRDRYGCSTIFIHHVPRQNPDRPRGHGAIDADTDGLYRITQEGGTVTLEVMKLREHEGGTRLEFRLQGRVIGTDAEGQEVTAPAVKYVRSMEPVSATCPQATSVRILSAMCQLHDGTPLSVKTWRDCLDVNERTLRRALKSLHAEGKVNKTVSGRTAYYAPVAGEPDEWSGE